MIPVVLLRQMNDRRDHSESRELALVHHTFESGWSSHINDRLPEGSLVMLSTAGRGVMRPWCRVGNPVSQFNCAFSDERHEAVGGESKCRHCVETWSKLYTTWATECRGAALAVDGPEQFQELQRRLHRLTRKFKTTALKKELDRLQLRLEMSAGGLQWKGELNTVPDMFQRAIEWAAVNRRVMTPSTFELDAHATARGATDIVVVSIKQGSTSLPPGDSASWLEEIALPQSMTVISSNVFENYKHLKTVHIPPSLVAIEAHAFSGCRHLSSMQLPFYLRFLGASAFNQCSSLKAVAIPKGVHEIGPRAFSHCQRLAHVDIANGVHTIGRSAFKYCAGLVVIRLPDSIVAIGSGAFAMCGRLRKVSLPTNLRVISWETFQYCAELSDVDFPPGLTKICTRAFEGCQSLSELHLPDGLLQIKSLAFQNCRLKTVSVAAETRIASDAFEPGTHLNVRARTS